jgi:hypothetical protein
VQEAVRTLIKRRRCKCTLLVSQQQNTTEAGVQSCSGWKGGVGASLLEGEDRYLGKRRTSSAKPPSKGDNTLRLCQLRSIAVEWISGPLPSFGTELDTCRPYSTLTTMTIFLLICWKHTRSVIPCSGHDNGRGGHCAAHFPAPTAARRSYKSFIFELLTAQTQTRPTSQLTIPSRSCVSLGKGPTTSTGRVPPASGSHEGSDGGERCCRVFWDASALPA